MLAGELCRLFVRDVRIVDVCVVLASLCVKSRATSVHTITVRVVDGLPEIFIDSSSIIHLPDFVGSHCVPAGTSLKTDLCPTIGSSLGGHEDDTICSARSVDGS